MDCDTFYGTSWAIKMLHVTHLVCYKVQSKLARRTQCQQNGVGIPPPFKKMAKIHKPGQVKFCS